MRLSAASIILLSTAAVVQGFCTFTFTGECTLENANNQDECNLVNILGNNQQNKLTTACRNAFEKNSMDFRSVTRDAQNKKNYQDEENFFNGGGALNDGTKQKMYDGNAGSIMRSALLSQNTPFSWPDYTGGASNFVRNFQDCDARVVMCCFTGSWIDFSPNAQVCHHELENSKSSNHVLRGMALFDDPSDTAYCTGFSWEEGEESERYAGNALFQASLKDSYWDKGYHKNIQSSPMCGCVEKMAAVSHSDCIDVQASETYTMTVENSQIQVSVLATVLSYGNCNGKNLVDHYNVAATDQEVASLTSNHIVGNCAENNAKYLEAKFLVQREKESVVNTDMWEVVMGKGKFFHPPVGDTRFRELINASANKIVYRHCDDCDSQATNIYYKRNSDLPPVKYDFMNMFQNYWSDEYNVMGTDFSLHSTYNDAVAGINAWKYCNFNKAKRGFPRDCGVENKNSNEYNNYLENGKARDHAFYVEKDAGETANQLVRGK